MSQPVAWSDFPLDRLDQMKSVPVVTCKWGKPLNVVIVGHAVKGVRVHWTGKRSYPCSGDDVHCQGCLFRLPTRWKGYIAAWHRGIARFVIPELTVNAIRSCQLLVKPGALLRGKLLYMERVGRSVNSPVKCSIGSLPLRAEDVPDSFDVEPHLFQMWFGDDVQPGKEVDVWSSSGI